MSLFFNNLVIQIFGSGGAIVGEIAVVEGFACLVQIRDICGFGLEVDSGFSGDSRIDLSRAPSKLPPLKEVTFIAGLTLPTPFKLDM